MTQPVEGDARGIIYIDAPLPATVLREAYRMNAAHERRVIPPATPSLDREDGAS